MTTFIKITHANETRRISTQQDARGCTFQSFLSTAKTLFPKLADKPVTLAWQDDDGDRITVSSDLEFQEAVRFMMTHDKVLRFEACVVTVDPTAVAAASASATNTTETVSVQAEAMCSDAVHEGVRCDECNMNPINGIRYKCTVRENFDLCSACEAKKEQPYPMIKIYDPAHAPAALFYAFHENEGEADRAGGRWRRGMRHGHHPHHLHRPPPPPHHGGPPGLFPFGEGPRHGPPPMFGAGFPPHHPHPHHHLQHLSSTVTQNSKSVNAKNIGSVVAPAAVCVEGTDGAYANVEVVGRGKEEQRTTVDIKTTSTVAQLLPKPALRFVKDVTYPDGSAVPPGTVFRKVWKVRNDGPYTWPEGCVLVTAGGDLMCTDELKAPLPSLAANEEADFALQLAAPSVAGLYTAYFRAQTKDQQLFGHRLWATILVTSGEAVDTTVLVEKEKEKEKEKIVKEDAGEKVPVTPEAAKPTTAAAAAAAPVVVAVAAAVPAPALKPLHVLWRRELDVLKDMGFVDAEVNMPLLQQHLVTPVALSGNAAPNMEGMQRVVGALLRM